MQLNTDRIETLTCSLQLDGAEISDVEIRACLEFPDNINYYFVGEVSSNGKVSITIPKLKTGVTQSNGKIKIEALIGESYFLLYSDAVQIKKSVSVAVSKPKRIQPVYEEKAIKLSDIEITENPFMFVEQVEQNPFLIRKL